jgi:flagellar hook-associated protein 2
MATTTSATGSTATTSNSGGALQSLGIGSGLDIATLVEGLTTAEMSAPNARNTRQQTDVTTQVSAIATLKSALSTFQSSLTSLLTGGGFAARNVTSANKDVVTATATASAALGSYQVEVQKLAQSHQLLSGNFTGGAAGFVGTGTLSFASGGNTFSVTIDSTNSTLAGIRDAINSATGNQSVSATLVYGQTGAQLVLTSQKTGAAAGITVDASGGDGGLASLAYGAGNTANYTEKQQAQDAVIMVSGVEHHSATNQVSDAIDGVSLNLASAKLGTEVAINITNDTDHVTSLVQSFVTAYNTLQTSLTPLDTYDSTTQVSGPLFGDAMFSGLKSQLGHAMTDAVSGVSGAFTSLAALGITRGIDGKLTMDSAKLTSALSSDFKAVSKVFSGATGVVARMNSTITTTLLSGGSVGTRSASLTAKQKAITSDKAAIDLRAAKVKERYLAKFNAMDALLAKMQNTASFLTQQMDALNRASKS